MKQRTKFLKQMIVINFLCSLLLFAKYVSLNADTIIETLYSIPYLDGGVTYDWDNGQYYYLTGDTFFSVGDYGWDHFATARGYLSFELPEIPDGYILQNAEIFIDQYHAIGNGVALVFPIWDVSPQPDTTGCVVDHIDYGNQLNADDWTAGDPGDSQTLHSNIGVISDNATDEFKNLDVTSSVLDDYLMGRDKTQYRLRFIVNCDWDNFGDLLRFHTSNSSYEHKWPYIIYTWWDGVGSIEEELPAENIQISTYPNPFNGEIQIKYSMGYTKNNLEIFNIKGQKVYSQIDLPAIGSIIWNCKTKISGIYFVKISNSKQKYVKKITYMK